MPRATKTLWLLLSAVVLATVICFTWFLAYPFVQITTNNTEKTSPGYALFAPTVDDLGHGQPEVSHIYLAGRDGGIVHSWSILGSVQILRLKPDGNLLYSTRDRSSPRRSGVREIDPFGNVLWFYSCRADHDFNLLGNGNLLIHTLEEREVARIGPGEIWCPRIVEVTRAGEVAWEWRGEEHLDELTDLVGIAFPLDAEGHRLKDWAHNNSCFVIGENAAGRFDPRFEPGNILISYCNLNTIAVVDRETGDIVWAWGPGELDGQHDPRMLPDGNILIFDNGTERGYSRVIEMNPLTGEIGWEYNDLESKRPRFFSEYLCSAQPLPNGNLFICEGGDMRRGLPIFIYRAFTFLLGQDPIFSRLFEIDRSGEIVWDCTITGRGRYIHGVHHATMHTEEFVRPILEAVRETETSDTRQLRSLPYIR